MCQCIAAVCRGDAGEEAGSFQLKPVKVLWSFKRGDAIPKAWPGGWVFLDFLSLGMDFDGTI